MSDPNTNVNEQAVPMDITIVDLQNLRQIVDVAARRGAFQAGEMAAVGAVYNKLDTFLAKFTAPVTAEQSAE